MDFENDAEPGRCFDCGGPAPWIILIAGEDEQPHEEWACEVHARGHWRWALVTPPAAPEQVAKAEASDETEEVRETAEVVVDYEGARYAW
ncbi:MAG: Transketolase [Labilithrix sp.]|nr:Transketolase [Labilithrix sp.]